MARGKQETRNQNPDSSSDHVSLGHISNAELAFILIFLAGAKIFGFGPTATISRTGSSAWLALVISTLLALVGLWGWLKWAHLTGKSGFVASLRQTLGHFLGDLVAVVVLAVFVLGISLSIRIFAGGAVIGLLPKFPLEILIVMSILSAIYSAWLGLEVVGRCATFFFPLSILSIIAIVLGSKDLLVFSNLMPVFGLGVKETLLTGLIDTGLLVPLSAAMVLKPYMRRKKDLEKGSYMGAIAAGAALVIGAMLVTMAFPYPLGSRKVEPLGVITRAVNLGRYVQRIEAIFTFSWFLTFAVQASAGYIVIMILFSDLAKTHTIRPFIPAIGVLSFGVSALPADTLTASKILERYVFHTTGNVLVFLGWVLFIIAWLRKVDEKNSNNENKDEAPDEQNQET
jgi:spore germination protein KB